MNTMSVYDKEERLKLAIESMNVGTWEWNVQTGETAFNERWAEIVGYSLKELEPISIQTWMDLAHPEDLEGSGQALEAHFNGETEFYDYKCRMKHKEGHWVWVHDRGKVITRDDAGKPVMMFGTHADITSEVNAETELKLQESRLRGLFELSPVGIALNDFETGDFIDINDALISPTGYTKEEFVKLSYWDVTPKEYEADEAEQLKRLEETGYYGPYEKEYIRKNGERYPVLLWGMIVTDIENRKMIWSIVEDITERKRIEKMKSEFVSTVSHELRTPLTSVSGTLSLLKGGALGQLPEQALDMISMAHKNSVRLTNIINDLLDMEKLIAGKLLINMEKHDIIPLIKLSIENNQSFAERFQVNLEFRNKLDLAFVNIDPDRLQQIMDNLISNAIKFSPEGESVVVTLSGKNNKVHISVKDNGLGIDEKFRDKVFDKFTQADGTNTRKVAGTGLGLAICKQLVTKMKGEIGFNSKPGKGADFWVEFPI